MLSFSDIKLAEGHLHFLCVHAFSNDVRALPHPNGLNLQRAFQALFVCGMKNQV
jgi:hypothetical protein